MRYGGREIDDAKIGPEICTWTIGGMGRSYTGTKLHLISVHYAEVANPAPWEPNKVVKRALPNCQQVQGFRDGGYGEMQAHLHLDYTKGLRRSDLSEITCKKCLKRLSEDARFREVIEAALVD